MGLSRATVESRLRRVDSLPTLPQMYQQICAMADDPATTVADFGALISEDPALTGKLLKLVMIKFAYILRATNLIKQVCYWFYTQTKIPLLILTRAINNEFCQNTQVFCLCPKNFQMMQGLIDQHIRLHPRLIRPA